MNALRAIACVLVLAAAGDRGVVLHYPEGSLHAFPIVRDPASDATIGVGTVTQIVSGDVLYVVVDTKYRDGLRVVERTRIQQRRGAPLEQLDWSVDERRAGDESATKQYAVDLVGGHATSLGGEGGRATELDGRARGAFAGAGVMFAAKNALPDLLRGQSVNLDVVAFTPAPRVVKVTLTLGGRELVTVGGRELDVDRVVVHPQIPKLAALVGVKAPDTILWFTHSTPPAIVRADTTIVEPGDRAIRIELLGRP
jgi:hypothetical protein